MRAVVQPPVSAVFTEAKATAGAGAGAGAGARDDADAAAEDEDCVEELVRGISAGAAADSSWKHGSHTRDSELLSISDSTQRWEEQRPHTQLPLQRRTGVVRRAARGGNKHGTVSALTHTHTHARTQTQTQTHTPAPAVMAPIGQ